MPVYKIIIADISIGAGNLEMISMAKCTFWMKGIMLSAKLRPLGVPRIVLTTFPAVSAVSPLKAAKNVCLRDWFEPRM